jgi:hypothetical protein
LQKIKSGAYIKKAIKEKLKKDSAFASISRDKRIEMEQKNKLEIPSPA